MYNLNGNYTDEDISNLMNGKILKLSSMGNTIWVKEYKHEGHESFPVNINYVEENSVGNQTALALMGILLKKFIRNLKCE